MSMENQEQSASPEVKAMAEINTITAQIMSMGGNDSEYFILRELIEKIKNKEIEAKEAVKKANDILEKKSSNYH